MKVLYVLNGLGFSEGMPIGGADKRALEIGKRLEQKDGVSVAVLTTQSGSNVLQNNGWSPEILVTVQPKLWSPRWFKTLLGRLLSYVYVTFFGYSPDPLLYSIVYPTSDFFFDLIPAIKLKLVAKRRGGALRLVGIVHHFIDWPWKRSGSLAANLAMFLSQRFGFFMLGKFADLVLVADTGEGRKVARVLSNYGVSESKLGFFVNGVDWEMIERVPAVTKKYQACFLGGLRASKGIFDLVPIWREVVAEMPNARLLVIGGGTRRYEEQLKNQVEEFGLEDKIILAGVVPFKDLFTMVKSSEVFISPSHEEGWGIVLCEAFACGLPVVSYDLPAFEIFTDGLVRVPLRDTHSFAQEVLRLLKDDYVRSELAAAAEIEARKYGWDEAAGREYAILRSLA